ncbi:MAG: tRNA (N6-threonylcarbamoyladenosine(37)-N6)-methyltransferase TrmO [Desulfobacter sp.]|nr:tRNA (N6-threonylcarbamoyladenosine(37)-N6)-methyltransferase TrmO [Desulfobacter sp.]WDP84657.1 MAG: tRNA (N6-threonylcarbamoyladenosine(37)-N6)-methyltransferase TrmO [Desulfobacter sp.]
MTYESFNWPEMKLEPVGIVKNPIKTPSLSAEKNNLELKTPMDQIKKAQRKIEETQSEIHIFEKWEPLLKGIDSFSHVLILYWPHLIDPEKRRLQQVHPMGRKDLPIQGIFATCSPARPNPVLVSAVPLVRTEKNKLIVKGFEAVDQSPVIDIKPYQIHYMKKENLKFPEWMEQINRELDH